MSKIIASAAIRGAHKIAKEAEDILTKAISEKGEDCRVEFPNTGYYMPIIYSMTGMAVEKYCHRQLMMMCGCLILVMPWTPVWQHFSQRR